MGWRALGATARVTTAAAGGCQVRLLSAHDVRRADRAAVEAGLPGLVLMETAGRTAAALLLKVAGPPDARRPVVVLAGGGNNGGDGLVLARWLARWAGPEAVRVYLAADPARLRSEAAVQWRLLAPAGIAACWPAGHDAPPPVRGGGGLPEDAFLAGLAADAVRARVVVDALLGVGARGPLRPLAARALAAVVASGAPVFALDLPSGLDADWGQARPETPRACWTVTFGAPKWGLVLGDGPARAGRVFVVDIGWPEGARWADRPGPGGAGAGGGTKPDPALPAGRAPATGGGAPGTTPGEGGAAPQVAGSAGHGSPPPARVIDAALAARLLPRRPVDAHKGMAGHVIVVGGHTGQAGAAVLAGRAALRTGAGTVTVAVPAAVRPEVAAQEGALMTWPLPDRDGAVTAGAVEAVAALEGERRGRVVRVIGPGLGRGAGAAACLEEWLGLGRVQPGDPSERAGRPTVLDADGLNLVAAAGTDRLRQRPGPFPLVLTPHPGEAARLLGCSTAEVQARRPAAALELAERAGAVVVLKGAGTLVAAPGGRLYCCCRGHPGMASAGMGDALAGVIGALLAQGLGALEAAVLGVYLHALAGELAAVRAAAGGPPWGAGLDHRAGPGGLGDFRPGTALGVAGGWEWPGLPTPGEPPEGGDEGHQPPGGPGGKPERVASPEPRQPGSPAGPASAGFVPVTAGQLVDHLPEALAFCARGWPDGRTALGLPGVAWLRPPLAAGRQGWTGSEV